MKKTKRRARWFYLQLYDLQQIPFSGLENGINLVGRDFLPSAVIEVVHSRRSLHHGHTFLKNRLRDRTRQDGPPVRSGPLDTECCKLGS